MRRSTVHLLASLVGFVLWLYPSVAAAAGGRLQTIQGAFEAYDLTMDWSDVDNPNGAWSYRHASAVLPALADWNLLTNPMLVQPAWSTGQVVPAWFKSASNNPEGLEMLIGDVVVHSSGAGAAAANVAWTSPISSVLVISGRAWMMRDIDRGNRWSLRHNELELTSGQLSSGDPYSRANPFEFSTGSGGESALRGIAVDIGDVIELRIEQNIGSGDFVGMELEIVDDRYFADDFE